VDGASIPKFAWSIIGGPFEGKYRDASVIHDVACVARSAPWEYVHLVFYYAMLASGVDKTTAKIMYAAVYHFGPRWDPLTAAGTSPSLTSTKSTLCHFTSGPRAGITHDYAPMDPLPVGSACHDGSGSSGVVIPSSSANGGSGAAVPSGTVPSEVRRTLTPEDFDKLTKAIKSREASVAGSMSLTEIESFSTAR
jgi:hypothetical protein